MWLASRRDLVLMGTVSEGEIAAGMQALVWLDGQAFWAFPVCAVESTCRASVGECLVGLVVHGPSEEDAMLCSELCLPGDSIEVSEAEHAV